MTYLHRYLSRLQDTILSRREITMEEMEIFDRSDKFGQASEFYDDNAPHHPDIKTYPHHKHMGEAVLDCQPPDLSEVLGEIDGILYYSRDQ